MTKRSRSFPARLALLVFFFVIAVFQAPGLGRTAFAEGGKKGVKSAAPTPADTAKEAKARGDAAMMELNYGVALQAYADAYAASNDPALLYNQARAEQALGDYAAALDFMDRFSTQAPASLKAKVPALDSLEADLKARVATVTVNCNVPGAEVVLRGKVLGTTPLAPGFKTNSGPATMIVRADGYLTDSRDVQLPGGGAVVFEVALHRKDETGVLLVRSSTAGANVDIDGTARGQVPLEFSTNPGRHSLRLSRDGYQPTTTSVVLAEAERKIVDVQLVKEPGLLTRWWFWTGAFVVVAGGVTAYILATHERSADSGSIAPGRVSAPLVSF